MLDRLTRDNLRGIWAAITTPFDANDQFDEAIFRENIRRLHSAGIHGVYTTDSDGEFYAIELEEFRRIVNAFADETQRLGFPSQVGVTWCNTQGTLDRLRHAAAAGVLGAHVGHPFFMAMTDEAYRSFWRDVSAAVPDSFGLIHYNSPRFPNYQQAADYAALAAEIPNLIGSKQVGSDFVEFLSLTTGAGYISHFTGEHAMTPFMMFGARGVYSWFANFNPVYMLDWYDEVMAGQWDRAMHRQARVHAVSRLIREMLIGPGHLHAVVGKALSAASSFLVPANRTRRPYLPVADATVARFRKRVEREFPDLIWKP